MEGTHSSSNNNNITLLLLDLLDRIPLPLQRCNNKGTLLCTRTRRHLRACIRWDATSTITERWTAPAFIDWVSRRTTTTSVFFLSSAWASATPAIDVIIDESTTFTTTGIFSPLHQQWEEYRRAVDTRIQRRKRRRRRRKAISNHNNKQMSVVLVRGRIRSILRRQPLSANNLSMEDNRNNSHNIISKGCRWRI